MTNSKKEEKEALDQQEHRGHTRTVEDSAGGKIQQMKQLVDMLNQAAKAYYQESRELMTNYEYDRLTRSFLTFQRKLIRKKCFRWIRRKMWGSCKTGWLTRKV